MESRNGMVSPELGASNSYSVNALAVCGTDLYAAGDFRIAGGLLWNRIAKWDGSTWSALGSGMNNTVRALAVSGTEMYAGGSFPSPGPTWPAISSRGTWRRPSQRYHPGLLRQSIHRRGAVTFTATVTGSGGTPTGTVTFKDGAAVMGTATLSSGTAAFTNSGLTAAGSPHSITAEYSGDGGFLSSTSSVLSQVVGVSPTISLQPTNVTVEAGSSAAFYASAAGTAPLSYQWYFNGSQPVAGGTEVRFRGRAWT